MKKRMKIIVLAILFLVSALYLIKTPIAIQLNKKALKCIAQKNYIKSEKLLKISIILNSNIAETWMYLIETQLNLNKLIESSVSINNLMLLSTNKAIAWKYNGQLQFEQKNYSASLISLNKSIVADSLLADAYYYRGIVKANMNDFEGAAVDYLKAQELDKNNIDALKSGINLLGKLNKFSAAIEGYNKLIEIDGANEKALLQRGIFKMEIMDYTGAINDFNRLIINNSENAEAHYYRGRSLAIINKYDSAISDFNSSIKLNFKPAASYYNIALANIKLENSIMAKLNLEKCLRINENNENKANAYHLLGIIDLMQSKFNKAIDNFTKALQIETKYTDAYFNRAIAYGYLKEHEKAINDLDQCINLKKTTSDVFFAKGVNQISLHRDSEGCKNLHIADSIGFEKAAEMISIYCK